jgi:methionine aminopeptidase
MEQQDQREETLATPGVLDKYQAAGKVANFVLEKVLEKIVPGAKIVEVCDFGDKLIDAELAKVYPKKKLEKGPAFPVCVSVNEIVGHYSPLNTDSEEKEKEFAVIKEGDVVKIDLGAQIDGFIALAAHTVVARAEKAAVVEGKKADLIVGAYQAL